MNRRHLIQIALALLIVGVFSLLWHQAKHPAAERAAAAASPVELNIDHASTNGPDDSTLARPEPDPRKRPANLPPSPLDLLNSPDTTPQNDVRLLATLFADYASIFKRVPLGMHTEIVAALRGTNPRSIQYIPDGHPAVNAKNEITDRWDEPFFFHVISKNAIEIISAGPDRELFTEDDIRNTPPHASVEPQIPMIGVQ